MTVIILHIIGAFVLLGAIIDNIIDTKKSFEIKWSWKNCLTYFSSDLYYLV